MTHRGPAEGVYLEAKLAVVAQQVEERIDVIESRRRRGLRLGMAALLALAIGGTAVTAAALNSPPARMVEVPVSIERLRCLEGVDAAVPAYFTVRYAVPAGDPDPVDGIATCRAAHETAGEIAAAATPEELLAWAESLLAAHASTEGPPPSVQHAAFGPVGQSGGTLEWTSCADASGSVVFAHAPGVVDPCPEQGG